MSSTDIYDGSVNTPHLEKMLPFIIASLEKTMLEEKKIYLELRLFRKRLRCCEGFNGEMCLQVRITHKMLSERLKASRIKIKKIEIYLVMGEAVV